MAQLAAPTPWEAVGRAARAITDALSTLGDAFIIAERVALHRSAVIEPGAIVKGPAIIGPRCFVAATAYLRGGVLLEEDCVVGPGTEIKTSLLFKGVRLAHFNFVGDSILGEDVNLEAGSVIANYRNERPDKRIGILTAGGRVDIGVDTFGALVGDRVRIGANAVISPGALLAPGTVVNRLQLVDQDPG
jgi:NDP-sugar pyrophosphorylase family protein